MKLNDYLLKKPISMNKFAKLIDRNVSTVSRICSGETQPDWVTLERIMLATGKKVMPNDFVRDV